MSKPSPGTGSMVKKIILLDPSTAAAVRLTAAEDHVSESELMARAIDDYLTRRTVAVNAKAYRADPEPYQFAIHNVGGIALREPNGSLRYLPADWHLHQLYDSATAAGTDCRSRIRVS